MKPLIALLGFFTLIVIVSAAVAAPREPAFDPVRYEYQQLEIEQARALAPVQTAVAAAWMLIPLVVVICGIGYLGALGVAHLVRFRSERMPNADGLLPVPVADISDVAPRALGAFHGARQLDAARQLVPHTVTYAPHETYSPRSDYRADSRGATVLPADESAPVLPPLIDLADVNWKPSHDAILLGLGPGGERISVASRALCHVALVGSTGGGKSNLMRMLLAQLLACGARVTLADPHYTPLDPESGEDWRPIEQRLHMAPASTPGAIAALFGYLTDELDRRIELRRKGQKWGPPLFLALDELPVIADTVDGAVDNLGRLLREGRKVGIYSVGASQSMLVKVIGGDSSAREAYRTAFYVGGDLKSATVLLDMAQRDIAEGQLGTGVAYLRSAATVPAQLVRVPLASNAGITALLSEPEGGDQVATNRLPTGYQQATKTAVSGANGKPDGSHMVATAEQATKASLRPESARALELFRGGCDLAEIVKELRGVKSNQGRAYQDAAREVQQLLREAM